MSAPESGDFFLIHKHQKDDRMSTVRTFSRSAATGGVSSIGKFNETLDHLISQLKGRYPAEVANYQYYENLLVTARKVNAKLLITRLMKNFTPFLEIIMRRDKAAFTGLTVGAIRAQLGNAVAAPPSEREEYLFENVKQIIRDERDEEFIQNLWQMLQLLVMQGAIVTRDPEQVATINRFRSTPLPLD